MADDALHTAGMSNATNPPKKRGCLFYGCLSLVGVGIVVIVTIFLAVYFTRQWALRTINQYTDANPAAFETITYSPAQWEELRSRLFAFTNAIQGGRGDYELILTANDLNVLIGENPQHKGKVFVTIDNDKIKGQVSIPINDIIPPEMRGKLPALEGRYLNGSATFRVALEGGALDVRLEELEAKGKPLDKLPFFGRLFADMKKRNLAANIHTNSPDLDKVQQCESLQIKDGKMIIRTK